MVHRLSHPQPETLDYTIVIRPEKTGRFMDMGNPETCQCYHGQNSIKIMCFLHTKTGGIFVDGCAQGWERAGDQCWMVGVLWQNVYLPGTWHATCPSVPDGLPIRICHRKICTFLPCYCFFVPSQQVKISHLLMKE